MLLNNADVRMYMLISWSWANCGDNADFMENRYVS